MPNVLNRDIEAKLSQAALGGGRTGWRLVSSRH